MRLTLITGDDRCPWIAGAGPTSGCVTPPRPSEEDGGVASAHPVEVWRTSSAPRGAPASIAAIAPRRRLSAGPLAFDRGGSAATPVSVIVRTVEVRSGTARRPPVDEH